MNKTHYLNSRSLVIWVSYCFIKTDRMAAVQHRSAELIVSRCTKEAEGHRESTSGQRLEVVFTLGDLISTQVVSNRDGKF